MDKDEKLLARFTMLCDDELANPAQLQRVFTRNELEELQGIMLTRLEGYMEKLGDPLVVEIKTKTFEWQRTITEALGINNNPEV